MAETRNYQSASDMDEVERSVSGRNFYVHLARKTNDAHQDFVDKLKGFGQNQVHFPEESDYLMVFCPIVSRAGTDISDALNNMPDDKRAILVVMHHTFNPDYVVAPSSRHVDNQKILLTVDCLFHERKLLKCDRNDIAWNEVHKILGCSQVSDGQTSQTDISNCDPGTHGDSPHGGDKKEEKDEEYGAGGTSKDTVKVSGRNFYVHLAGKTNDAHQDFVDKLKGFGQNQVHFPEESDYLMVFCPIATQVGRDISDALNNMPGDKRAILVVMRHTFNPDYVVAPSSRHVDNQNILLTVDCLFHERKLLKCNRNDIAWNEVHKILGRSQVSDWQTSQTDISNCDPGTHGDSPHGGDKKEEKDEEYGAGGTSKDTVKVSGRNFYVHLAGKTNDAHQVFVDKLKGFGQNQVHFPEESDYLMVFCPIATQVGTDISDALNNMPGDKRAILVVMHHTFNPDYVVAPSSRHVDHHKILLTVDCLFYERKLLKCNRNDIAWNEVHKILGCRPSQVSDGQTSQTDISNCDPGTHGDSPHGGDKKEEKDEEYGAGGTSKDTVKVSGRNFYVHLAGKTNDAHQDFVDKLKGFGQNQVHFLEESDYLMVFCPIATQVGTDISDALNNMPGDKRAILVVMRHTFNPDYVVAPSSRYVDHQKILLTVDCLFYERKLLKCNHNDIAWNEVHKILGCPPSQVSLWRKIYNFFRA